VVEVVVVLVVVDDELVVVVGVVLRVVLVVVVESVRGVVDAGTVTVVVLPPHPAKGSPAANAKAASGASVRLMALRRGQAVGARSRDSR
jgi:hypothetical protein